MVYRFYFLLRIYCLYVDVGDHECEAVDNNRIVNNYNRCIILRSRGFNRFAAYPNNYGESVLYFCAAQLFELGYYI